MRSTIFSVEVLEFETLAWKMCLGSRDAFELEMNYSSVIMEIVMKLIISNNDNNSSNNNNSNNNNNNSNHHLYTVIHSSHHYVKIMNSCSHQNWL